MLLNKISRAQPLGKSGSSGERSGPRFFGSSISEISSRPYAAFFVAGFNPSHRAPGGSTSSAGVPYYKIENSESKT